MSIEDGKENRRNLYTQWQQQHTMFYMLLGPSTSKTFRDIMAFSIFILFLLYALYVSLFHVYRERQQREMTYGIKKIVRYLITLEEIESCAGDLFFGAMGLVKVQHFLL
jgi:hypothetical protein